MAYKLVLYYSNLHELLHYNISIYLSNYNIGKTNTTYVCFVFIFLFSIASFAQTVYTLIIYYISVRLLVAPGFAIVLQVRGHPDVSCQDER